MIVVDARNVRKYFVGGDGERIDVLNGVSLAVEAGEMVAIVGSSGSGKSTLLHILGALERPSAGTIVISGAELRGLDDDALARHRNMHIGFVFQFHHLLKEFSALENVMMPLLIGGSDLDTARTRAMELMGQVGLLHRVDHRPHELSGGEQQRAAVARALARRPAVLLADEPSGNLDHAHSEALHDLLAGVAQEHGIGVVVVTHNPSLAARAGRVQLLRDGELREATVEEMTRS